MTKNVKYWSQKLCFSYIIEYEIYAQSFNVWTSSKRRNIAGSCSSTGRNAAHVCISQWWPVNCCTLVGLRTCLSWTQTGFQLVFFCTSSFHSALVVMNVHHVVCCVALQVVTWLRCDPGDAEETRHCGHRVDRVALDAAHHCLAPEHHHSSARYSNR